MSFLDSFYTRAPKVRQGKRHATAHDVFMFEAIVGKASDLAPVPDPQANSKVPAGPTIQAIVKRAWKPRVAQISVRLRAIYEQGVTQKRPQMAEWLKHLSDQAVKRIDQAQSRLAASRPGSHRRRVEAREVMSVRPRGPEASDYKRVASSGNVAA